MCHSSIIIYNFGDVDALRIPADVSSRCDVFPTRLQAQSDAVLARHSAAIVAILPAGPEFASPDTFLPTGAQKMFDALAHWRTGALAHWPRSISALCVFSCGDNVCALKQ